MRQQKREPCCPDSDDDEFEIQLPPELIETIVNLVIERLGDMSKELQGRNEHDLN